MDEQHQQVKALLTRAADAAGVFEPPAVDSLTNHRRAPRSRSAIAIVLAAAVVLALAIGLSTTGADHDAKTTTSPRATTSPTLSLPGPTGRSVPATALKSYEWSALPAAPIVVRGGAASAWTGHLMIVWGGQTSDNQLHNDGATYDPTSRKWATLPSAPLSARTDALSAWLDGSFIVWGGTDDNAGHHATDGARYDPHTGTWAKLPAAPISSYDWAALVVADKEAVLLSTPQAGQRTIHADAYDPASNTWHSLSDFVAPPDHQSFDATALGLGTTVLVWSAWFHERRLSGNSTSIASGVDTYALDTKTNAWTPVPLKPDRGQDANQLIWTGKQILLLNEEIYCGPCSHPFVEAHGVAIEPRTGKRTPIPNGPLSPGLANYYWTGAALLALDLSTEASGPGHSIRPGDAAAWDPDTNSWTRLSSTTISGDADEAATVWTGTRLLVWGITTSAGKPSEATPGLQFAPPGS